MSKTKKLLSILVLISVLVSTSLANKAQAASFTTVSDRISDSDKSVAATHVITFTSKVALANNEYFEVTLPSTNGAGTAVLANVTCSGTGGTLTKFMPSDPGRTVRCLAGVGGYSAGTTTITVTGVTNPTVEGSYSIPVISSNSGGTTIYENATALIAVISSVTVSANVPSSLSFAISGLGTSTVVNTATSTGSSTPTALNFGVLQASTTYSSVMAQQLHVTTNAGYGFKVTVEQDQNMTSLSGATIDSFQNNTPPGSPISWTAPTATLDATTTYGHMGFTTDDSTLSSGNPYGSNKWMGFSGSSTQEVMYHNGPADGSTVDKGSVKVAFRIQISALQEAGDYSNVLTYVATPTY
jgi:hypothetical protein